MKILLPVHNDRGIVLVAGLMFLSLLAILGSTAYMLSSTDVMISANYKATEQAFNDAEAGVQFAKAAIESHLKNGGYLLENIGETMSMPGTIPGDFSFTFSALTKIGDNTYGFTSTGAGPRGATAEIDVGLRPMSAFEYAVFGRDQVDLKNSTGVFSYNSLDGLPDPGDTGWDISNHADNLANSTHNADIGSNGDGDGANDIILNSGCYVDGDVVQGASGDPLVGAAIKDLGGVYSGEPNDLGGPVEVDPLDIANDPDFNNKFANYDPALGGSNDNNLAIDTATNTTVGVGTVINTDGYTLVGKSGGTANYYFDEIMLGSGQTLKIDATIGPINIWVKGELKGANGSLFDIRNTTSANKVTFNVTEGTAPATIIDFNNSADFNPDGQPSHVIIKTDTTKIVSIHNGNVTKAIIYAPFAPVDFDNGAAFYGAVRGATVTLRNSMKVFYDEAIMNAFLIDKVTITSWRQVLN